MKTRYRHDINNSRVNSVFLGEREEPNMKLSHMKIDTARSSEKMRKLTDGGGLYMRIESTGGKLWRFDYRFEGKRKTLPLGKYPDVSLQEARRRHQEARTQLAQGIDPMATKKAQKAAGKERAANSLEVVAREWFEVWKTDKSVHTYRNVTDRLEKDIFPYIGKRPISAIAAPEVLAVLRRIEERGAIHPTHHAKNIISQVMRYAIATGRADRDPCPDLRGALKPKSKPKHFAAVTTTEAAAALLRAIDTYHGGAVVRSALRLLPLVFCRPGELRLMKWKDVDLDSAEWKYTSTKRDKEMIVPLSRQAVDILEDIQQVTGGGEYVFPGDRSARPFSGRALIFALRSMGYDQTEMTAHGFRAMARTIMAEKLRIPPELIELQMTHKVPDPLNGAYDRTKFLDDRRRMMQPWADYLHELKTANFAKVVPFERAAG
jgi:integrase